MRISDWSSDVCSSDLEVVDEAPRRLPRLLPRARRRGGRRRRDRDARRDRLQSRRVYRGMIRAVKEWIKRRWPRLRLRTILFASLFFVAALPGVGAVFLRVYENTLVRQTEAELVAQGARSEEHTSELQSLMRI